MFCKHDYEKLFEVYEQYWNGYRYVKKDMVKVYCHKCEKVKNILPLQWKTIAAIKEVKEMKRIEMKYID
jgi:hypothetical protein